MRRIAWFSAATVVVVVIVASAMPAGACGGLVGENGTIQLTRTTTLAAQHDGIERYVTSFEFAGVGQEVGSIVPLPGVPTKVERGGDWTLQRLEREVQPPVPEAAAFSNADGAAKAEVLQTTKIDALDITILRGGGNAVGKWAIDHGFLLTPDAPAVLDFYSSRSKVFMAARFDANRAQQLGQQAGDGTPIMLTIPTEEPWVPLRILSLGLGKTQVVNADVFLLTDQRPALLAGDKGLRVAQSGAASSGLLADLRSDKGMGWVPDHMWLTYLKVDAPASDLDYDLAISTHTGTLPSARLAGFTAGDGRTRPLEGDGAFTGWPDAVLAAMVVAAGCGLVVATGVRARHRAS
jgi:hypothetical protein